MTPHTGKVELPEGVATVTLHRARGVSGPGPSVSDWSLDECAIQHLGESVESEDFIRVSDLPAVVGQVEAERDEARAALADLDAEEVMPVTDHVAAMRDLDEIAGSAIRRAEKAEASLARRDREAQVLERHLDRARARDRLASPEPTLSPGPEQGDKPSITPHNQVGTGGGGEDSLRVALAEVLESDEAAKRAAKAWAATLVRRGYERPVPPPELAAATNALKAVAPLLAAALAQPNPPATPVREEAGGDCDECAEQFRELGKRLLGEGANYDAAKAFVDQLNPNLSGERREHEIAALCAEGMPEALRAAWNHATGHDDFPLPGQPPKEQREDGWPPAVWVAVEDGNVSEVYWGDERMPLGARRYVPAAPEGEGHAPSVPDQFSSDQDRSPGDEEVEAAKKAQWAAQRAELSAHGRADRAEALAKHYADALGAINGHIGIAPTDPTLIEIRREVEEARAVAESAGAVPTHPDPNQGGDDDA